MRYELRVERVHQLSDPARGEPVAAGKRCLRYRARVLEFALGDEDGGEPELTEGATPRVGARTELDDLLGVQAGGGELLKRLHADRGLGGQRCVIEGTHPR